MVSPIDIQKALQGIEYPASKDDLVGHAESQGGGDEVLEALRGLDDQQYDGPTDVEAAVFH
ncbi:DUF2795 domain-containing protein [Modestobacter sp. Leaf380]|uniref:DUF2795 domain-containing protein n=1 Tax=Modestobacter sp. Leaf380 TaxID=1736356 RepID=UPI0006FBED1D|nr:DUF2795 domain-containing protein [Modestobacter sp. Leaf380]KQS73336.1 hypothetical protein ASG41_01260 [Modestobacter sp. Leaf380]